MVFLSYSWRDAERVHQWARKLHARGCDLWLDVWNADTTAPIAPQIEAAVRRAALVAVAMSPHARRSPWVRAEVSIAQRAGIRVANAEARALLDEIWR